MTKTHPRGDGWGEEGGVKTPQEIFFFFFCKAEGLFIKRACLWQDKGTPLFCFFPFPLSSSLTIAV